MHYRPLTFLFMATILLSGQESTGAPPQKDANPAVKRQGAKKAKQAPKKKRTNGPLAAIKDDPKLPRVLLIGDSISIGYTIPVRNALAGKANVHRPSANCGPTTRGLTEIDKWLGDGKWDVIHFNWGLHDLKYMGPQGQNLADPNEKSSHQQVPPEQYEKNLRKLVDRLVKTKAKLIWRSTTPVPEGAKGRVAGDSAKYNAIALKVMADYEIEVDDMYSYSKAKLNEIQLPKNVHFSKSGSAFLAGKVAAAIERHLK